MLGSSDFAASHFDGSFAAASQVLSAPQLSLSPVPKLNSPRTLASLSFSNSSHLVATATFRKQSGLEAYACIAPVFQHPNASAVSSVTHLPIRNRTHQVVQKRDPRAFPKRFQVIERLYKMCAKRQRDCMRAPSSFFAREGRGLLDSFERIHGAKRASFSLFVRRNERVGLTWNSSLSHMLFRRKGGCFSAPSAEDAAPRRRCLGKQHQHRHESSYRRTHC